MSISIKEKELAAVGISVAAGCKPCTAYHVNGARKARATDAEIEKAVNDSHQLRTAATEIMRERGLAQSGKDEHATGAEKTDRVQELLAVGAAFALNCTASLEKHLEVAETVGISAEEISEIVTLARFIKEMAASRVEELVKVVQSDTAEADPDARSEQTPPRGCC